MASLVMAWFPPEELTKALALWPEMIEWPYRDHVDDCRRFDGRLRELSRAGAEDLGVAPVIVDDYRTWCGSEGVDAAQPESRARYAAELARRGEVVDWPPADGAECWCGRGRPYWACCAQPRSGV